MHLYWTNVFRVSGEYLSAIDQYLHVLIISPRKWLRLQEKPIIIIICEIYVYAHDIEIIYVVYSKYFSVYTPWQIIKFPQCVD